MTPSLKPIEPNITQQPNNIVKIKIIDNNSGKESIKCVQVDQPIKPVHPTPFSQEMAKEVANNIVKDLLIDHAMKVRLKRIMSDSKTTKPMNSCLQERKQTTPYASLKNLAFKKSGSLIQQDDGENWDPLSIEIKSLPNSCKNNQLNKQKRISWDDNIIF